MPNFDCIRCGKEFKGGSHWKTRPPKHCSRECRVETSKKIGHFKYMASCVKADLWKVPPDQMVKVAERLEKYPELSIDNALKDIGLTSSWGRTRLRRVIGENRFCKLLRGHFGNNRADRGNFAERKIASILRKDGWIVYRSAGSKGLYDLIAYKENEMIFIQVKRTKKPTTLSHLVSSKEIQAIKDDKIPFGRKEIWIWTDGNNHREVNISKNLV